MADSSLIIVLDQTDPLNANGRDRRHTALPLLEKHFAALAGGNKRFNRLQIWADGAAPRPSRAVVTMASSTGTVGATINGVAVTVTWATSDINSSTLFAAAVTASTNVLVQYLVQACNIAGSVRCVSVVAGEFVEFNVVGLGTFRFTGKSGGTLDASQFDASGNDTAKALSLATQINNRAGLNKYVLADPTTDTVAIRQISGTTAALTISASSTTFPLVALSAAASTLVSSLVPGVVGNCQTIAASGTNVTINGSLTRLAAGTGGNATALDIIA